MIPNIVLGEGRDSIFYNHKSHVTRDCDLFKQLFSEIFMWNFFINCVNEITNFSHLIQYLQHKLNWSKIFRNGLFLINLSVCECVVNRVLYFSGKLCKNTNRLKIYFIHQKKTILDKRQPSDLWAIIKNVPIKDYRSLVADIIYFYSKLLKLIYIIYFHTVHR